MKKQILEAIEKGIRTGLLESGFNFSLDDLDHMEDYGLKKKKVDRQFFKDEFDRQQKEYEISQLFINKILNEEPLSNKEKERFNTYSNKLVAVYKVNDSIELNNLIYKVIEQFGNTVNLNWIDVSNITDMSVLFSCGSPARKQGFMHISNFNGDISKWDVSNVENMEDMFGGSKFNGDISNWNVSKVKNMEHMFLGTIFNGNISGWDVSNVENMHLMFNNSVFNANISDWDVSKVKDMSYMFRYSEFNQEISKWDVSNVKLFNGMFINSDFNQDISNWDISNAINIKGMFDNCPIKEEYKPKSL